MIEQKNLRLLLFRTIVSGIQPEGKHGVINGRIYYHGAYEFQSFLRACGIPYHWNCRIVNRLELKKYLTEEGFCTGCKTSLTFQPKLIAGLVSVCTYCNPEKDSEPNYWEQDCIDSFPQWPQEIKQEFFTFIKEHVIYDS